MKQNPLRFSLLSILCGLTCVIFSACGDDAAVFGDLPGGVDNIPAVVLGGGLTTWLAVVLRIPAAIATTAPGKPRRRRVSFRHFPAGNRSRR